ncbi:hypothetical protein ACFZDJ_14070 [Streptomyces sp. NPDC007896]|uniref:hypothetical protein n=1 Tax=Streptomyces sp. NPDC007896 TaxID=3364784 RepID=UPI0036EB01DE
MTSKIPVRGGRKGQRHRATPEDLRTYEVTPASEVTVTQADGTVQTRAARASRAAAPTALRRGPAVCAMCGDPIEGKVWVSREQGPCRGKPVHPECEKKAVATEGVRRRKNSKKRAGPTRPKPLSLVEENRRLFASQDRIRQQARERAATAKQQPPPTTPEKSSLDS